MPLSGQARRVRPPDLRRGRQPLQVPGDSTYSSITDGPIRVEVPRPAFRKREEPSMRVLHITRQFHPSMAGVERYTLDLCRHLIARGVDTGVVTLDRCFHRPGRLPSRSIVDGVPVTRIPFIAYRRLFLAPTVLRHLPGYDLLHVHNLDFFSEYLLLTRALHRKPVIVSTHGGYFHSPRFASLKSLYLHTVTRVLLPQAAAVVARSEEDGGRYAQVAPGVRVIEGGFDAARYSSIEKRRDPGLLLYVGRLAVNKRVDLLIRALPLIRRRVAHAHLVVVGPDTDGLRRSLGALAHDLGVANAVQIIGQVDDAAHLDWLARANLFTSASEYEGFGLAVVEAMSTGTVPVVNDLPSYRNFVRHEDTGYTANFSSPHDAAEIITRALSSDSIELKSMGDRARAAVAAYSWDSVGEQILSLYEEIHAAALHPR